ncbi:Fumarylacetoacetate hydrolase family protein [Candidatus Syntrophocurvum alkaliphilum]|uniref:Fumarylacetoacetate hydrolase family protein n=1 Tax=Candidatus Syntrophocurvum alkaliphilum TaxID=2293317 RepID=A0A6I6DLG2_9FIRM|nr:fumarylacetoacetate hydrolase family protein [Candidatus Syntrophocurvum alkaliphilum]QGU00667.1 Fumarylacetoacetate hydrolase family protein [Candidatus Syntrophocurvum alkaliphilum]
MYFATYSNDIEKVGVITEDGQRIIELGNFNELASFDSMIDFIINCSDEELNIIGSSLKDQEFINSNSTEISKIKLCAPIKNPRRNIICLGLNYRDHIQESQSVTKEDKTKELKQPVYFSKMASVLTGPDENVNSHKGVTEEIDYEVELAVIIGKDGTNIPAEEAEDYIFGYSIFNDVSARDLQRQHKQWIKGKSLDTFSVLGPYIVHKSEIPFPVHLNVSSKVNGELRQSSNTKNLIFDLPYIISDLSKGLTLKAGDIIATGTPAGVGMGFKPPKYLKSGDVVELEIEKIGVLRNKII